MEEKGTILYIGGFELPDMNAAAHRVLSNGKILKQLGYQVVFIGIDKSLKAESNIKDTKKYIQGFDSWSIPYPNKINQWPGYLADIENTKTIFGMYNDVKLVIAYNYPALSLNRLMKYCERNNCKIVADCTEWYSTKGAGLVFKVLKGLDSFFRMRVIQKKLDGIIVISTYLEKYYTQHCPTVRIPPLVDKKEEKWAFNNRENDRDYLKFVFSGTIGMNKDSIDIILEVLHELKDSYSFLFEIVGIDRKEYLKKYPHHIKMLHRLEDKVIFSGRKSHIQSIHILKSSDFCIFIRENNFSTNAGFPTKFVESISSGVPVITSESSDLSEYLKDGCNGFLLNIEDRINIREKLEEIFKIGKSSLSDVKNNIDTDRFHFENYLEKTKFFLEEQLKL